MVEAEQGKTGKPDDVRALEVRTAMETLWFLDSEHRVYDVYTLLDGARDPWIYDYVRRPGLFVSCLYDGKLPTDFARTAPYLASLSRQAWSTRDLLTQGLGESWGIYFHSNAGLGELKEHFRRFLQVQDETGRKFFFRFFDPRVLRAYLPTCDQKELFDFFGPVRRFILDGEQAGTLWELSVAQGKLRRRIVPLVPEPS